MSALSNQPRMATIRAAEPVQALVLSPQHFVALLGLAPYLVEEFQVASPCLAPDLRPPTRALTPAHAQPRRPQRPRP